MRNQEWKCHPILVYNQNIMDANFMFELYKLNVLDRKVACWLYSQSPNELYDYLEFIATKDYLRRGIKLNVSRALYELHRANMISIGSLNSIV